MFMIPVKKMLLLACLFIALKATAQTSITVKGDTLLLPNGSKFWLGKEVTLSSGSLPDKSFNFIYQPELLYLKKKKPLDASYAGQKAVIKKFQRDGIYKGGYAYNIIVLAFTGGKTFWCDVQNALSSNEIAGNRTEPPTSKEARLLKLKKLLDDGEISTDEYRTLKNKLMNSDAPVNKTKSKTPIVF
jgi:hypothetical protein